MPSTGNLPLSTEVDAAEDLGSDDDSGESRVHSTRRRLRGPRRTASASPSTTRSGGNPGGEEEAVVERKKNKSSNYLSTDIAGPPVPSDEVIASLVHQRSPYVSLAFTDEKDNLRLAPLRFHTAATFECWVRPEKESSLGYIIFKKSTVAIGLRDGELLVAFGSKHPGWKWIHSGAICPRNSWSHVTVVYDGDQEGCRVYLNGVLRRRAVVKGPLFNTTGDIQVGVHSFNREQYKQTRLYGQLADVRIWSFAIPHEKVALDWGKALAGDEFGLLGHWPCDEAVGSMAYDRSDSQAHGTITGARWRIAVNVPQSTLSSDMGSLLDDQLCSDITLVAGLDDTKVFAHKVLLVSRCEVFRAMLLGGMREEDQAEVVLQDLDGPLLRLLLQFIYTDAVEVPDDVAMPLFVAADRFRLERLQRLCEQKILDSLSVDTVCQTLEAADALHAMQLRGICFTWIVNNFGEVLKSDGFIDLDRKLQREINFAASQAHFNSTRGGANTSGQPSG